MAEPDGESLDYGVERNVPCQIGVGFVHGRRLYYGSRETPGVLWETSAMKQFMGISFVLVALLFAVPANGATGEILKVRDNGVKIYDAPTSAAQVLMTLDQGRRLKELRRQGPWIKVIIYGEIGKDGWIHSSNVGPMSAGTEKAAKPDLSADSSDKPAQKAAGPQYILVVKGSPQQFRANCRLITHEGATKKIRHVGRVPKAYAMEGKAARCRVDKVDQHAGILIVGLYKQGRSMPLGANSTQSAFGCVSVRSSGPWGKAYGRECSRIARRR